jgi:hypothetical protein
MPMQLNGTVRTTTTRTKIGKYKKEEINILQKFFATGARGPPLNKQKSKGKIKE